MSRSRPLVRVGLVLALLSMAITAVLVILVATTHFRSVRIAPSRTIQGDLVSMSARVNILGPIRGDLNARALYLRQVGGVSGDVTIVAGRAELRGPIGQSVHIYGGSISLYGTVAGDVEMYGGQLTVVEEAVIGGDLIVHGGIVTVVANSQIQGTLRGEALMVTIEGQIDGNVDLSVVDLTLAPGAIVGGSVRYESRTAASIAESASVRSGSIVRVDPADRLPGGRIFFWHAGAIPRYAMMLVIAITLTLFWPRAMANIADIPRRGLAPSLLKGLGVVVFGPILLATAGLFVITLPVIIATSALLLMATYLSMAIVGLTVGRTLLRRPPNEARRLLDVLAVCIGITVLAAIRVMPAPFVDPGVAILAAIIGLGAMLGWIEPGSSLRRSRASQPLASFVVGGIAGSLLVALAVLAILAALSGSLAALATLSGSAQFTWEVAPRRMAATALAMAGVSLLIGAVALVSRRQGRSRRTRG